jgi:hypothetical protein
MILDGSNGVTFNDASLQGAAASPYVLKNRIINGDMVIDQRNAGASLTITAAFPPAYTMDRFWAFGGVTSKFSVQQNAGSVTPPAGFTNYLGCTSLSAYSVGSSENFLFGQYIEGFNVADLDFGKATAKTITLSFWVRSSLTGTFGGSFINSASNRSYVFSYTISAANTWEQKSITVAGDTSGTWLTNNGVGLAVNFSIGSGSTFSTTAGSWVTGNFLNATGATSVVGTNGATFYITGVQLEQNTSATPFERRLYGQELVNCQRYYWKVGPTAQMIGTTGYVPGSGTVYRAGYEFPVPMRATPTINFNSVSVWDGINVVGSLAFSVSGNYTNYQRLDGDYTTAAGLATGKYAKIYLNSSYIDISAEL